MLQPHKKFSSYTGWKGHIYAAKELNAVIYLAALNSTYRPNTRPGMHSGQPQKHQLGTASSAQLQERVAAPQGCGAMVDKASGGSVTLLCPLHRARADSPHQHRAHKTFVRVSAGWELGSTARKPPEQLQQAAHRMGSSAARHSNGSVHREHSHPLFGLPGIGKQRSNKAPQPLHPSTPRLCRASAVLPTGRTHGQELLSQQSPTGHDEATGAPPNPGHLQSGSEARSSSAASARAATEPGEGRGLKGCRPGSLIQGWGGPPRYRGQS